MVELDTSNGVMFPIYDPDTNLVYLCGKVTFFSNSKFVRKKKFLMVFFLSKNSIKIRLQKTPYIIVSVFTLNHLLLLLFSCIFRETV